MCRLCSAERKRQVEGGGKEYKIHKAPVSGPENQEQTKSNGKTSLERHKRMQLETKC